MMKSTKFKLEGYIFTFFGILQLVFFTACVLQEFFVNMFPVPGIGIAPSVEDILKLFGNWFVVNLPTFAMIGIGICAFKFAKEEETK